LPNIAELQMSTDKQADKAARRAVHLDARVARIVARRDERVEKHKARIKKIEADAAARLERINEVRKPLKERLIEFVNVIRGRKQRLMLSTGTQLDVYTNYRVEAVDGDDEAAAAELEALGHTDKVRVKKEPNRQLLSQKANRHIIDQTERLSLVPVKSLKIQLSRK